MPDEFKPVRLASVGTGLWGTALAEAAVASNCAHIVSCYAPSAGSTQAFADRFHCRPAASFQALMEDETVEGLLLATPNSLHRGQIEMAAAHGKHVLVEKPLALTLADALRATQCCADSGVILAVGHQYRRQAAIRQLKQLIEAGRLGQVIGVEANLSTGKALGVSDSNWRWSAAECPGGPLIQIGIHYIDILNYLFGPIARVASMQRHRVSPAAIDDATVTILEHAGGVLAVLVSHYVTARVSSLRVSGTLATASYDALLGLSVRSDSREQAQLEALPVAANAPLVAQITEFARCIRTHQTPEVGGAEGAHALAVVLAAVAASQTGRSVEIAALYQQAQAVPRPTGSTPLPAGVDPSQN